MSRVGGTVACCTAARQRPSGRRRRFFTHLPGRITQQLSATSQERRRLEKRDGAAVKAKSMPSTAGLRALTEATGWLRARSVPIGPSIESLASCNSGSPQKPHDRPQAKPANKLRTASPRRACPGRPHRRPPGPPPQDAGRLDGAF